MRDPRKPYPTDYLLKYTLLPLIPHWITPNQVTVLRIVLTPVAIGLIVSENYAVAIPFFLFVALTDAIDGAMARVRNQITDWGTMWDPIADKFLIGSAVFVIVLEHVNILLGLLLLVVELVAVIGGYWRYRDGKVYPANLWGKAKMVLEVVGVVTLLFALAFNINLLVQLSFGTLALAVVFAIASLLTHHH
jgi:CDP-diacylglycerol--glycerol-3-phosphate 3-phosphatidyltransferase